MNRKLLEIRRKALADIAAKHRGILRPSDVVNAARDPEHVLHGIFEWDDSKAAREHRLWQAREIIAAVQYVFEVEEHVYTAPEWVRDPRLNDQQGYVALDKLRTDKELARDALVNEFSRAGGHLTRAYDLARALKFRPAEVQRIVSRVETLAAAAQGSG